MDSMRFFISLAWWWCVTCCCCLCAFTEAGFINVLAPCCFALPSLVGHFGPYPARPIAGEVKIAPTLACEAFADRNAFANKILVIARGNCSFAEKVFNAQEAGAAAAVIYDNVPSELLVVMGGDSTSMNIVTPNFFIGQASGQALIAAALETGMVLASINTTQLDYRAYYGTPNGMSIDLVTFGITCGALLAIWLLYAILYTAYHCKRRVRGKRLVQMMRYHTRNDLEQQQQQHGHEAIENGSSPPQRSPPSASTCQEEEGAFSLHVVHSNTIPDTAATTTTRHCACCEPFPASTPTTNAQPTTATTGAGLFDLGGTCSICLEDFVEDEMVFVLPCRHLFHDKCVSPWLRQHGNCPNCKRELDQVEEPGASAREVTLARLGKCLFNYPLGMVIPIMFISLAVAIVIAFCVIGAM